MAFNRGCVRALRVGGLKGSTDQARASRSWIGMIRSLAQRLAATNATAQSKSFYGSRRDRGRLGKRGEDAAVRMLRVAGYRIHARNIRYPVGEIDIIAWEGHVLCFVEVRSTASGRWGGPLATIDSGKRHRMIQAARWYLARHADEVAQVRFDVVGIEWDHGRRPQLELVRNVLQVS